ncbi:MAG: DNA methyltransferase [Bacteroidota bacterium]|nr:DNA methyltransferase [Bacteroidota bacterium]
MKKSLQLSILEELFNPAINEWTFNGASTRELTHCYHDYPARMIPQIAEKLIDLYGRNAKLLFDPYCGTGTSLVEGVIRGIDVIGTDINPLARMISQAKTSMPSFFALDNSIRHFNDFVLRSQAINLEKPPLIPGISRIEFWFKPQVIEKLLRLKIFIETLEDDNVCLFFKIAFSETVRESSNTRNDEFKLYRYQPEKLKLFNPNVFYIMSSKLKRNRLGLERFVSLMSQFKSTESVPIAKIYGFNTVEGIPEEYIRKNSVDIVVTSPPYGDSHTTVAYGQYSRLSAAWLGLEEPEGVDRKLMGGKIQKKIPRLPSEQLTETIELIAQKDQKRANEVASFYQDLYKSITNVAQVIKPGGFACYVVGNRKVKGIVLPTDVAIINFFSSLGYEHIDTHNRVIPNKRMPLRNSPTNVVGINDETMTREYIVVMRRRRRAGVVAEKQSVYRTQSKKEKTKSKKKRAISKKAKRRSGKRG